MGFTYIHRRFVSWVAIAVYLFALSTPVYATSQTGSQQQNSSTNKIGQAIDGISGLFALVMGGIMIHKAKAGGTDAPMEYMMGGMMILTGLGQLANAAQMGNNAAASDANVAGATSLAPTPTSLGQNLPLVDPSLLGNSALTDAAKQAGIDPGQLANALQGGVPPASAISQASDGKIPASDVQSAMDAAGGLSPDQQKDLLAKSGLADMQAKLAAGIGSMDQAGGTAQAAKSGGDSNGGYNAFTGADDPAAKPSDAKMSKEVTDALAAKAKQDQLNGLTNVSIFQQVHKKYAEKFGLLYGQINNSNAMKGIAGPDGRAMNLGAPAAAGPARQPASLQ